MNIGTNDLNDASVPFETVIFNFRKIVKNANNKLQILAKEMGLSFIDLNSAISDENGNLRPEFSVEGMHVNEAGYEAIFPLLQPVLERI